MISYDLDPSLHSTQPQELALDDGFSPPPHADVGTRSAAPMSETPDDPALWAKSEF